MEFLPPDIAPLHDPALSECDLDVCLDQRRAAEDVCSVALGEVSARNQITVLWNDIELAINNPHEQQAPNIMRRASAILGSKKASGSTWFQARVLVATEPLFVAAMNRTAPSEAAVHQSYREIGRVIKETFRHFDAANSALGRSNFAGRLAELAVHGVLLRSHNNIPYLASQREESGAPAILNHDIAAYKMDNTRSGKLPIQVGVKTKPSSLTESRILPLGVTDFLQKLGVKKFQNANFMTLANVIVQDSDPSIINGSLSRHFLAMCGEALNEHIDQSRATFHHQCLTQSIEAFVSQTAPYRINGVARGRLKQSIYTLNDAGQYIFADRIQASHALDSNRLQTSQITFSYRNEAVSKIGIVTTSRGVRLTEQPMQRGPGTPQRLLQSLGAKDVAIDWERPQ